MNTKITQRLKDSPDSQINLIECSITDPDIPGIASFIANERQNLHELYLSKNQLTDSGIIELSKTLSNLPNLRLVDIQFNKVGEEGFKALLKLKENHPDFKLHLHGNLVTDVGRMLALEESISKQKNKP